MNRILKRYDLPFPGADGAPVPGRYHGPFGLPQHAPNVEVSYRSRRRRSVICANESLRANSDDFYVLSSGLITLETTIDNNNETLARQFASVEVRFAFVCRLFSATLRYSTLQVVLEWARNVLANRLATDARSWASVFSRYASGTYTETRVRALSGVCGLLPRDSPHLALALAAG